ncbi:MAG: hydrogenobyrinic acid a,c-diamide synthase (glutamine-hydrolyzing) [Candidatus Verstraetearchaeota archaeon]|nr:hydrogenobyrinic acid a,c-diamide synthase (glutamine-hydrolyzing) [Candidatus Verstraetearchaeota archaeon]
MELFPAWQNRSTLTPSAACPTGSRSRNWRRCALEIPRIVVSAAASDSGKTLVTAALLRILVRRGIRVQPFKVGPDYIDPMYHRLASGRPCRNLDSWIMDEGTILSSFISGSNGKDIAVIEGVRGLYEGESPVGDPGSTVHVAKILKSPVVLVLNCHSLTRSAAAQILGLKALDREVLIAGVILNKVSDARHEEKLRRAISHYTGMPVLGVLYRDPQLEIKKRHLGLITSHELPGAEAAIERAAEALEKSLDLDRLLELAASAPPLESTMMAVKRESSGLRIGFFIDAPFSFYYHENVEAFRMMGAEISVIDSLSDRGVDPEVSGVIIGGGYPEVFSEGLEGNQSMRHSLKSSIYEGMPAIGECGGLMYLCRTIEYNGIRRQMVGVFDGDVIMHSRPKALSYVELESFRSSIVAGEGTVVRGHEFHYSSVEGLSGEFTFRVLRGKGIRDHLDGIMCQNAIGMYTHLHYLSCPSVPARFLDACRAYSRC